MFGGHDSAVGIRYNDIYIIKLTKDTVVSNLDTNLSVPLLYSTAIAPRSPFCLYVLDTT